MGKTQAAGIFIVNRDRKLLVCHPTNHKADFWSIPKGKIDEGESYFDCALRETYEETNIDLKDTPWFTIVELPAINYKHGKKMLHPYLYWENINSEFDWSKQVIKCNSNVPDERGDFPEMDDYKWVSIDEARTLLHDTQVACLDRVAEEIKVQFFTLYDGDNN